MTALALPRPRRFPRVPVLFAGLVVALVVVTVVAAGMGQYPIPAGDVASSLLHKVFGVGHPLADRYAEQTLWQIRFPRVVLSLLVGAGLAAAGSVLQGVFGNPLADPAVVGVSSGSALGAAIAVVAGVHVLGILTVPAAAFVTGVITTFAVYALSRSNGRAEVVTLLLTGIAVNAVAGAGLALCTYAGSQQAREQIVFWQLGSLAGAQWSAVQAVLPFVGVGLVGAVLIARRLDLLALGDRSARHLGIDVERTRMAAIGLVAVMVAAAVAFAGVVGFVGLMVPHLIRMVTGPGQRVLVPASALGGALLVALADLVARTAVHDADLPLGVLTALVGGPTFFWLLRRTRSRAGGWA